jgi:phosphate transport system ATP-binding protein
MRSPLSDKSGSPEQSTRLEVELETRDLSVYYGSHLAVKQVSLKIPKNHITAFIGPSGCGKSTILRCFNRMNDLIPGARVEGSVIFHGKNIYDPDVDPSEVRRRVGLVFQKPNPFPKSTTLPLGPGLMATRGIWTSSWSGHCARPFSGMR